MSRDEIKIPTLVPMLLAIAAFAVTAILVLSGLATSKRREVQRGWEATLGTREQILAEFPPTEANEAALELERRAAALGIDITPRWVEGRPRPSPDLAAAFRSAKRIAGPWLDRQIGRPFRSLDEPPAGFVSFRNDHADELEAVRRQLARSAVPTWESDIGRLVEAPIPNLLGQIDLQKLLLADALARAAAGDVDDATLSLEASWTLNRSLRDAPILVTQLVAISVARLQVGVLRQVPGLGVVWRDRLYEHDHRASFFYALRYEGWSWSEVGDPSVFAGELNLAQRVTAAVVKPYVRYCVADLSGSLHERIEELARRPSMCGADVEGPGVDLDLAIPRWNLIGDGLVPNLSSALHRLTRLEVDRELTAKLLELESARRADGWPERLAGLEESSACPDDRWLYRIDGNGRASLALSRTIEWPDSLGVDLPTRFRL